MPSFWFVVIGIWLDVDFVTLENPVDESDAEVRDDAGG